MMWSALPAGGHVSIRPIASASLTAFLACEAVGHEAHNEWPRNLSSAASNDALQQRMLPGAVHTTAVHQQHVLSIMLYHSSHAELSNLVPTWKERQQW